MEVCHQMMRKSSKEQEKFMKRKERESIRRRTSMMEWQRGRSLRPPLNTFMIKKSKKRRSKVRLSSMMLTLKRLKISWLKRETRRVIYWMLMTYQEFQRMLGLRIWIRVFWEISCNRMIFQFMALQDLDQQSLIKVSWMCSNPKIDTLLVKIANQESLWDLLQLTELISQRRVKTICRTLKKEGQRLQGIRRVLTLSRLRMSSPLSIYWANQMLDKRFRENLIQIRLKSLVLTIQIRMNSSHLLISTIIIAMIKSKMLTWALVTGERLQHSNLEVMNLQRIIQGQTTSQRTALKNSVKSLLSILWSQEISL